RHDARIEAPLLEVHSLDVAEAAQDGVDLAADQRRQQVEADVDLLDGRGGDSGELLDLLPGVALVRDARGADGLSGEVRGARDPALGQRDQRGKWRVDHRRHRLDLEPLLVGEQNLGLVGDREVYATGRYL